MDIMIIIIIIINMNEVIDELNDYYYWIVIIN